MKNSPHALFHFNSLATKPGEPQLAPFSSALLLSQLRGYHGVTEKAQPPCDGGPFLSRRLIPSLSCAHPPKAPGRT